MEAFNESTEQNPYVSNSSNHFSNIDIKATKNNRSSIDYGYESLLSSSSSWSISSSFNSSNSSNNENKLLENDNFSHPSTPVKESQKIRQLTSYLYNPTLPTSCVSPDLKQNYVADVNGMYFAKLRQVNESPYNNYNSSKASLSTSSFSYFSASNSNSPCSKYYTQSPKFVLNTDDYFNERDNFKTKLLRSPILKINQASNTPYKTIRNNSPAQSKRPVIKSFSSRFGSISSILHNENFNINSTQEEFMDILIKNRHIPNNPEFLIGRHMGVEKVDILSELNKRSMNNVIDKILNNLHVEDFVRIACVSREWRKLIKDNITHNQERIKFIKEKRKTHETSKENRNKDDFFAQNYEFSFSKMKFYQKYSNTNINELNLESEASMSLKNTSNKCFLSASEKREIFRNLKNNIKSNSLTNGETHILSNNNSDLFAVIDVNCLMNIFSSNPNEEFCMNTDQRTKRIVSDFTNEIKENDIIPEQNLHSENYLKNTSIKKTSNITMRDPKKVSSARSFEKIDSSPQLINKKLKVSPVKFTMLSCAKSPNLKHKNVIKYVSSELIGSQKSKKNLKRL